MNLKLTRSTSQDLRQSEVPTWRDLVQTVMEQFGGEITLKQLYSLIEDTRKARNNPNWQAKIRQTLQLGKEFTSSKRGVWSLMSEFQQAV